MEAIYQDYKDQGFIIVDAYTEDANHNPAQPADALAWKNSYGHTFVTLADGSTAYPQAAYNMYSNKTGIPENIIIGRDMVITYHNNGWPDPPDDSEEKAVRAAIEAALAK